jgi:hypothetical protein
LAILRFGLVALMAVLWALRRKRIVILARDRNQAGEILSYVIGGGGVRGLVLLD